MTTRYVVVDGSTSAHCCFVATVVDTDRPEMIGGEQWEDEGVPQYEAVCECFEPEDAERIAAALNAMEAQ